MNQGPENDWKLKDMTWHTGLSIHGAWTAARLDYDRDGDLDLIAASPTDAIRLFRNDIERSGTAINFRLVGDPAQNVPTDGYGTRVTVYNEGNLYFRELQGGGSGATSTQNSNMLHFGVGRVYRVDSVVVQWPNGTREVFRDLATEREYRLQVGGEGPEVIYSYILSVDEGTGYEGENEGAIALSDLRYEGGAFRFDLHMNRDGNLRVEVVNSVGETIAAQIFPHAVGGPLTIPVGEGLPSGVYLLRVTNGKKSVSAKVVL